MPRKAPSLIGQHFGRLLVVADVPKTPTTDRKYECLCLCGNRKVVLANNLRRGLSTSCGCGTRDACSARADLTGQRFRKLTVVERVGNKLDIRHSPMYACRCDCGNTVYATSSDLRLGKRVSCGCARIRTTGFLAAAQKAFGVYASQARKRGYAFDLDLDTFIKLAQLECYYCGAPPANRIFWERKNAAPAEFIYNGIDRKNNELGYFADNVVPSCFTCNRAKMDRNFNDYLAWMKKSFEHLSMSGALESMQMKGL